MWHGGEPLALGRARLTALLEPFEPLRAQGRIRHVVQTAATLIDDQWCGLFQRYEFAVGVSIDGPEHANRHRVDRRGRPTFGRAVTGIHALNRHNTPTLQEMIVTRRRPAAATSAPRMGTEWGRKGNSWGKGGQFHKNR